LEGNKIDKTPKIKEDEDADAEKESNKEDDDGEKAVEAPGITISSG
jgi:hypothetical protein